MAPYPLLFLCGAQRLVWRTCFGIREIAVASDQASVTYFPRAAKAPRKAHFLRVRKASSCPFRE